MARRVSMPAADDLFRPTADTRRPHGRRAPATASARPPTRPAARRAPSGRVRHDEKMTVYVTSDELLAVEQARLALRREHGLAVDRGRLVREALALVLADLEAQRRGQRCWCAVSPRSERRGGPRSRAERPEDGAPQPAFAVRLDNFEGPFDLLLNLIAKHKLDITEVALSQVTDEFIAHVKAGRTAVGPGADDVVPPGGRHAARPQGGPAAAPGRRRGRGGPRAARGARPALRPAASSTARSSRWPRCSSSGSRRSRAATRARWGWRSASPPCCPRCSSASGWSSSPRSRPGRWRPSRSSRCRCTTSTPPGLGARAGRAGGRPAAPRRAR